MLSDPDRRAQYDRYGRVDLPLGGPDLGGLEDLFGDLFEGFFGGGRGGRRGRTGVTISGTTSRSRWRRPPWGRR